jgi:hypothetical protein
VKARHCQGFTATVVALLTSAGHFGEPGWPSGCIPDIQRDTRDIRASDHNSRTEHELHNGWPDDGYGGRGNTVRVNPYRAVGRKRSWYRCRDAAQDESRSARTARAGAPTADRLTAHEAGAECVCHHLQRPDHGRIRPDPDQCTHFVRNRIPALGAAGAFFGGAAFLADAGALRATGVFLAGAFTAFLAGAFLPGVFLATMVALPHHSSVRSAAWAAVLQLSAGVHFMQDSKWLGHSTLRTMVPGRRKTAATSC